MKIVTNDFTNQKNKVGNKITPIYLYSIQYDQPGNKWLRLAKAGQDITFDGITYKKYAIRHTGTKETLSGRIEKVALELGNVNKEMQYYLDNYDGLKKCQVTIKLVWAETLDDTSCFIEDTYTVETSQSNQKTANLTLASGLDVMDIRLPQRNYYRHYCRFLFKGIDCGYSGSETTCDKTFNRCEVLGNTRRFGGFPGVPMRGMVTK